MIRHLLAMLVLAGGLVAFAPSAAHADNGCPGTRDVWATFNDINGDRVATLEGYNTASGGHCYALVSRGQYRGVAKYMELTICTTAQTNCQTDAGNYASYAGPITRSSICVYDGIVIKNPSGNTILRSFGYFGSCD